MEYTRLYTGTDGKSHFSDVELPEENYIPPWSKKAEVMAHLTDTMKSTGIFFLEWLPISENDWHRAPRRQFVIVTEGALDITAGDGVKRRFGPGAFLLVEDLTGSGHLTELVENKIAKIVYVPL
jgi:quercetin dioxygenase-like cupin family protein